MYDRLDCQVLLGHNADVEQSKSVDSYTQFIGDNSHCSTAFDCSKFYCSLPLFQNYQGNDNVPLHQSQEVT
jgi:hypothetical protein